MILRRLATAFRKQDWVTVLIETLIVVFGVFLGIQLGNWNEARVERDSERVLLLRLQEETRSLLDTQSEELAVHLPRMEVLTNVHPVLFSLAPSRLLTDGECRTVVNSHWLPSPTDELSALDELISSGRFDLISSQSVKQALREYAVLQERARSARAEAVGELFRLHSRHPDATWLDMATADDPGFSVQNPRPAGEGLVWRPSCDIAMIRGNKGFLSDYGDNHARLGSYIQRYEERIAVLTELDAELTKELGTSDTRPESEAAP